MKRIIRVFPRRTRATPDDDMVRVNCGPELWDKPDTVDEVHISVAFTWDLERAEQLAKQWEHIAPVKFGGPATGERGGEFIPGRYLKHGYVITSRGCPNRCWFCEVPKREGGLRELPVREGWNILDDNLLACSEEHIRAVFAMLKRQKLGRPEFTGGFEAARLELWHVELLAGLKPAQIFFAYDQRSELNYLQRAGEMLLSSGWKGAGHAMRCFVLCGYPGDELDVADNRMWEAVRAGFAPMAMLYRDDLNTPQSDIWKRFQRRWVRPALYAKELKTRRNGL